MRSLNSLQIQQALQQLGRGSLVRGWIEPPPPRFVGPPVTAPPAQSMRRAVGVGDYDRTGDWSWMYNPPPFDFLDRRGVHPPANFYAPSKSMGLGCGCGCSGSCNKGFGLFDSLSPATWGFTEWAIVAGGAFVLYHAVVGTSRARSTRRTRRLVARAKWGTE